MTYARSETQSSSPAITGAVRLRSAKVLSSETPALLRLESDDGTQTRARVAVLGYEAEEGDRVLWASDGETNYVVGILRALRAVEAEQPEPSKTRELRADGAYARLEDEGRKLRLRDDQGRLLFEYDANLRKHIVYAPEGDVEFRVDRGAFRVQAREGVFLESDRTIALTSKSSIESKISQSGKTNALTMDKRTTKLEAPAVHLNTDEAQLHVTNMRYVGRRIESAVHHARQWADVWELRASRLLERSKTSMREVEGVAHTRAGRIRTVAKGALQLLSKHTRMRAEKDIDMDAERIRLG